MIRLTYLCFAFLCVFTTGIAKNNLNRTTVSANSTNPQLLRIDFTMPNGYVRHLVIGFTDDVATDGYDYGYDALNVDNFPDDLNWLIENKRYVIQGVGTFNETKKYPLGMFLTNSGNIKISLDKLENFENPIDVYVYDAKLDTYTQINYLDYTSFIYSGEYLDRFYIAFKDNSVTNLAKSSLSTPDEFIENTRINYLGNTKELYINTSMSNSIKSISIFNLNGQKVYTANGLQEQTIRMALSNLKGNYGIVSVESDEGFITTKQIVIH
ncbi:T9SS type A sorting domain-containing protein [Aestuariivivens sediminis]|uniref:T9SS type A sorting domain-containing protein n=1 Tax=Aestuariivivens sediminis TaxID=2913557 RepID=UPI001F564295|nr:T9SS type A sorting domain-containing protein [Aestuariivivens sediminis]